MSSKTLPLTDSLYAYLLTVGAPEPEVLRRLRAETQRVAYARMQIAPEQGQLMALLVELIGARKCLEIGVYTGYSSLAVALALPEHGKLLACDINAEWTQIAQRYWHEAGVGHKVELRLAPALRTLEQLRADGQENSFDFVFIDADKGNYCAYYEHALALLRRGGLLAIDNVLWDGKVADAQVQDADTVAIRALNSKLSRDARVRLALVPIGDGLSLAAKL